MEWRSLDNQTIHSHQTSERLPSELFIQITRHNHARTCKRKVNANSVSNAPSTTTMKKEENWLTPFQISQKASLSHQCQISSETATSKDTTTTTTPTKATMTDHKISAQFILAHWTLSHHPWFKLPVLLKWQLLVDSTQISIFALRQLLSRLSHKALDLAPTQAASVPTPLPKCSSLKLINSKWKCTNNRWCSKWTTTTLTKIPMVHPKQTMAATSNLATTTKDTANTTTSPTTTTATSTPDHQRRTPSTDTKRKKTLLAVDPKTLLKKVAKKETNQLQNRKDMSLSNRRLTTHLRKQKPQPRLTMLLLNEYEWLHHVKDNEKGSFSRLIPKNTTLMRLWALSDVKLFAYMTNYNDLIRSWDDCLYLTIWNGLAASVFKKTY